MLVVEFVPLRKEAGEFLSSLVPIAYGIFVADVVSATKLTMGWHFVSAPVTMALVVLPSGQELSGAAAETTCPTTTEAAANKESLK